MIQQVYLNRSKVNYRPDFDKPIELIIGVDELDQMMKTLEVLFDRASVERIKQARKDWKSCSSID